MNKKNSNFFIDYYEKSYITNVFQDVFYTQNQKVDINPNYEKNDNLFYINKVIFIPNYIVPRIDKDFFKVKKINQFYKGYAILLDGFLSVDSYLKFRFKKNAKTITKKIKRLENCFNINYSFYYGNISEKDYAFFMTELKEMLQERFKERNDTSQSLLNWNHYYNIFFNLINKKKASLFVIKNNDKPICISIGNHYNGKFFSHVSSYDINYGKFSLGNIEIYKKLEWCVKNNHNVYEFGMGDLNYKREWSNHIYNFEQQLIYPKRSLKGVILANIEFLKVSIKVYIYNIAHQKYRSWKLNRKKRPIFFCGYTTKQLKNIDTLDNLSKVNYNSSKYSFLRKPVYDFLYYNMENQNDVSVYKTPSKTKSFVISSKSKNQQIVFD